MFSKYAAEHGTGARTADILIASAPGLWVGAVDHGYLQPFTPAGISSFPAFISRATACTSSRPTRRSRSTTRSC